MDRGGRTEVHRIVIVGGGAGGLELATRLGDTLGKRGHAQITLVDSTRTHLWKPLLHEVAAGSLDADRHALDYLAQARWHHFRFQLGALSALDRASHEIEVDAWRDADGETVLPPRRIAYDTLVVAIGSQVNHFGTRGAAEHGISLDTPDQARRFHRRLINACLRANAQREPLRPGQLKIAIIGGGATGVELAAELHNTIRELVAYGLERIEPAQDIRITVIEAAPRILPQLPERLSTAAAGLLQDFHVQIFTSDPVVEVTAHGVRTQSGREVPAELTVWAAGIQAPAFLAQLDGLEVNRLHQLVVAQTLQTTRDPDIFALGDCAACPWPGHQPPVPPRAQAAHQQASHLAKNLDLRLAGRPLRPYVYRDFGSLISLGDHSTVGSLMGRLMGGALFVEGLFARLMYVSLYKMHLLALHGWTTVALGAIAGMLGRRSTPRVKLH